MKRKICCIYMILFFLTCILGSSQADTISVGRMVSAGSGEQTQAQTMLLPVSSLEKMDDFHVVSDTSGNASGALHGICQTAQLLFCAVAMLLFGMRASVQRFCLSDKRIPVFRIVQFIHRTDGKKKSCFDSQKNQNRRMLEWKSEQNTKYYQ